MSARRPTTLNSLWSRVDGFWACAAQILGLSLALQLLAFATPFYLQLVTDQAVQHGDLNFLTLLAVGFGALAALQAAVEACRAWTLQVVGQLANFQITGNLVRHLLRVRADYFEKRHIGDIMSRLGSAKSLQEILTRGIATALLDGVMALGAAILLFVYSPLLTGVVLVAVALHFGVAMAAYPAMRRRTEEQLSESGNEQSLLMETVRAATTIRLLGGEAEREGRWRNAYARVVNASVSAGKWQISVQFAQTLIHGVQTVVVVFLAARMVMHAQGFSLGMLLAFLALRQTFTDRASNLVTQSLQLRLLGLHLERLGDIVQAETEVRGQLSMPPFSAVTGRISLIDVDFQYGVGDPPILKAVTLEVAPGEFLAITGPSGGGKTTLLKLMVGLLRPNCGRIELEGLDASPAIYRAWRQHLGVVAQDDRLLSGSLAANIAFFDAELDIARVVEAARAALIHEEIVRMPMQYMTLVGDMGSALSGGQRQRVLLARALYRRPSVLFLDEGTANLDVATERQIAGTICAMPITRVVVAHRPALLELADRVLVVHDGRLIDATGPKNRLPVIADTPISGLWA